VALVPFCLSMPLLPDGETCVNRISLFLPNPPLGWVFFGFFFFFRDSFHENACPSSEIVSRPHGKTHLLPVNLQKKVENFRCSPFQAR